MGCKVESLIDRHALTMPDPGYESIDEYLVARWTGSDGRSADGYKALTEWFNKRLLKRLYEDHDRKTISVHLDREYEVITGADDIQRDELAADLATDDLDINDIENEMVSWSTMRHHLKGCLEAEKDTPSAATDWEANTVEMAQERAAEKAHAVLSSLKSKRQLRDADRVDVDVQVKLSCPECSVRVPFADAVERGFVCETHSEAESDESGTGRVRNQSSAIVLSYVVGEVLRTGFLGDSFLVEAVHVLALSI